MQSVLLPTRRRVAPIVTMLLLPPIIGEFLFGSTHLTTFFYACLPSFLPRGLALICVYVVNQLSYTLLACIDRRRQTYERNGYQIDA
jgi:hypothetical protein